MSRAFQPALRRSAALLALAALLFLHLHVLSHVFGHERQESAKEAPCPLCLAVLGQTGLAPVATVSAPPVPVARVFAIVERSPVTFWTNPRTQDPRGPPRNAPFFQS